MVFWILCVLYIYFSYLADTVKSSIRVFRQYPHVFFCLLVVGAVVIAGFRFEVGYDYTAYEDIFNHSGEELFATHVEPGFALLAYTIYQLGGEYQLLVLVCAVISLLLVAGAIKKYSLNPTLSMVLFLLIPSYYAAGVLSIIRQALAISIFFFSIQYIIEKNFFKYLLSILIASLFHKTAITTLPFYFLVQWNFPKILLLGLLVFVLVIPIPELLVENPVTKILLLNYEHYVDHEEGSGISTGTTVIVRIVGFLFVLFLRDKVKDRTNKIIINLYLIGSIIYCATLSVSHLNRIAKYYLIVEIITIANILYLFRNIDRRLVHGIYILGWSAVFLQNIYSHYKAQDPNLPLRDGTFGAHYQFNLKLIK